MHPKRLAPFRPLIALACAFAFWLFGPVVIKTLLRTSFYEFQAPVAVTASYVRQAQDIWSKRLSSKKELAAAGEDLARLNAAYELTVAERKSLALEVSRLEDLLRLPSRPGFRYEIARVVDRDFNAWWQRITIRKGKRHGIRAGDPVVFTGGVVGRVKEAGAYTAIVDLISNNHLRLAVVVEGDNRILSFSGDGARSFGEPLGRAEFVPTDIFITDSANPPRLITSGMGGAFPPGLTVGSLVKLQPGASGMFYDGIVQLDKRLNSINEVAVLVPLELQE